MHFRLAVLVTLLIVLHQDNWLWTNDRLLLGFMPIGLAYHMGISIAASCVWYWATCYCWPEERDAHSTQKKATP